MGEALGTGAGAANDSLLEEFKATLPDIEAQRARLLELEFFALCPDGRRIPVRNLCEEYKTNPNGLVLRTFEDRLVLVIQAMFPGKTEAYWQQAFYLSTGTSSGMPGTWLPFDGLVVHITPYRPSESQAKPNDPQLTLALARMGFRFGPSKPKKPGPFEGSIWFSKNPFHNFTVNTVGSKSFPNLYPIILTLNQQKNGLLHKTYGELYLPEGYYLDGKYGLDRFGTMSYALASHAIGGNFFAKDGGVAIFMSGEKNDTEKNQKTHLDVESPLQDCFLKIANTYPISNPNTVNRYIETFQAFSYMNTFREHGFFPPGLSFLNTPMKSLGYSLPLEFLESRLKIEIHEIWLAFKKGEKTLEEVRGVFANPRAYADSIVKELRKTYVFPNEPGFFFNIGKEQLEKKRAYYGGARRQSKKKMKRAKSRQKAGKKTVKKAVKKA